MILSICQTSVRLWTHNCQRGCFTLVQKTVTHIYMCVVEINMKAHILINTLRDTFVAGTATEAVLSTLLVVYMPVCLWTDFENVLSTHIIL